MGKCNALPSCGHCGFGHGGAGGRRKSPCGGSCYGCPIAKLERQDVSCGGTGAGATFPGASAVHSHMTNSRITDPGEDSWRRVVVIVEWTEITRDTSVRLESAVLRPDPGHSP